MRYGLVTIASVACAWTAIAPVPALARPTPPSQRPNLVIFLADDLGLLDTKSWGGSDARTPNLDSLAGSGLTFDRAFVASPACAPSRAALLTGLMPARNGAEANQAAPRDDVRKLPAYLQELGYEVAAFGKVAHYQQTKMYGFDHFEHDTYHDPEGIPSAVRWLKARQDTRPLAIFIGSNWPHVPWPKTHEAYDAARIALPPKTVDTPLTRSARARYYAAIGRLDDELGQALEAVDSTLGPDTFVMFSSDHGAQWPFAKWNLYDTGIRRPMVVRWKGRITPGTRTGTMVSWIDILPTLVDLGGGKPASSLDGRSFAPLLRGETSFAGRSEIYATHNNDGDVNVYPMRSVRTARWKYINNLHPEWVYTTHEDQWFKRPEPLKYFPTWRRAAETDPSARTIVQSYYHRPGDELYDIVADPAEKHNLADDPRYASTLADLRARLSRWRTSQQDDRPVAGKPHLEEGSIDWSASPE